MYRWIWIYKRCLIYITIHGIVEDVKKNKFHFLKETTIYLGIRLHEKQGRLNYNDKLPMIKN